MPIKQLLAFIFIVCMDGVSKALASHYLLLSPITLTSFLSLELSYNCGVAFGAFSQCEPINQYLLITVAIFLIIGIFWYLKRYLDIIPTRNWGFLLIASGAFGNIIDRMVYGYVIDFIRLHYQQWAWPTFNIADCAITLGTALLIICDLKSKKKVKP